MEIEKINSILDSMRFELQEIKLKSATRAADSQNIKEIKIQIEQIFKCLHGNGEEGLKTQVLKNTDHRNSATKLMYFLVAPLYGGLIGILVKLFM